MVDALDALIDREAVGLAVRSPLEPARRTGHVAFAHENAWQICQALIARGVIGDFREPDILRLAGAPLSTSFGEVAAGMIALAEVLESGEWSEYPATKSRIT
jgi:kynureninase